MPHQEKKILIILKVKFLKKILNYSICNNSLFHDLVFDKKEMWVLTKDYGDFCKKGTYLITIEELHIYAEEIDKYWEKKNGTKKATFNDILTSAISYYGLEGYENDYYIIETPLKQIVKNS